MDKNLVSIIEKKLDRTVKALCKNRFEACVIHSREEMFAKLQELLPPGVSCSVGGSMTLFETGVIDFLKNGEYTYLDRYAPGADIKQVFHDALSCQVYITSANAITETGEIYNIDATGNRVASLVYGPEKVVIIAGQNKIVPDLSAARIRVQQVAAPANSVRLNKEELPCFHTGVCGDCNSSHRLCAYEVICRYQSIPGRITVLLLNESVGY